MIMITFKGQQLKDGIATKLTEIKSTTRTYYQQLYANKLHNLGKMD